MMLSSSTPPSAAASSSGTVESSSIRSAIECRSSHPGQVHARKTKHAARSSRKRTPTQRKLCKPPGCGHMNIQGDLTRHETFSCTMRNAEEIASAEMINKCRVCGKSYTRWDLLVHHFEDYHPDVEDAPTLKLIRNT